MGAAAFLIGAAQILEGRNGKKSLGSLVVGYITIVIGLIVIFNPLLAQSVLFFSMPFWALLAGFGAIATSLRMRSE